MKRIILAILFLMCCIGTVSAYGLYIDCPAEIQVGLPLKCSIDSDFPAGTTFDLVFYQTKYTATEVDRQSVTIQENKATQYRLFDTKGFPGGNYKVEVRFIGADEPRLRSDSVTIKLVSVIDRSNEITITSPLTQDTAEALRIEGSIAKEGTGGVELEVRGPDGRIFGPQWIGTTNDMKSGDGIFTKKVAVFGPGDYEVYFKDAKGFIGIKTFKVVSPVITQAATTNPTATAVKTTRAPTTVPTPLPTPTQSPLSSLTVIGACALAGLLAAAAIKKF
jgi:hypothetical protein